MGFHVRSGQVKIATTGDVYGSAAAELSVLTYLGNLVRGKMTFTGI